MTDEERIEDIERRAALWELTQERDRTMLPEVAMVGVDPGVNPPTVLQIEDRAMTAEEQDSARISIIERWLAATDQCIPVFALRWLLGEYRRLAQLDAEHADATDCLMQDAARWRKIRRQVTANEIDKIMRRMPAVIDRSAIDAAVDAAIAREQADGKA